MANKTALTSIVKTKIDLVQSQASELHGLLDRFIIKEIAAIVVVDSVKVDVNTFRVTNSRLDVVLDFLLQKCAEIEDLTADQLQVAAINSLTFPVDMEGKENITFLQSSSSRPQTDTDFPHLPGPTDEGDFAIRQNDREYEARFDRIEKQLEHIQNNEIKFQLMERQVEQWEQNKERIETNFDRIKNQLENLEAELKNQKNQHFVKLKEFGEQFCDGKSCLERIKKIEAELQFNEQCNMEKWSEMRRLMTQVETKSNQTALYQINTENQMADLQNKVSVVEEKNSKHLEHYTGKLEETESLYKQVCQMVASQVKPLLHLKDILSKYHHTKELQKNTAAESSMISAGADDRSSRTGILGPKNRVPVGFTAYWGDHVYINGNSTLIFSDVLCNEGNCYDTTTGHFTSPYTGLYFTSLTLRQRDDGLVRAQVRLAQSTIYGAKEERTVCKSLTSSNTAACCDAGVVWMEVGDELLVKVSDVESKPKLSFYSSFSCILIG